MTLQEVKEHYKNHFVCEYEKVFFISKSKIYPKTKIINIVRVPKDKMSSDITLHNAMTCCAIFLNDYEYNEKCKECKMFSICQKKDISIDQTNMYYISLDEKQIIIDSLYCDYFYCNLLKNKYTGIIETLKESIELSKEKINISQKMLKTIYNEMSRKMEE